MGCPALKPEGQDTRWLSGQTLSFNIRWINPHIAVQGEGIMYARHLDGFLAFFGNGVSLGCKPFGFQVKSTDCFPEDLGSGHSTHLTWLPSTSNSSFRGADALFWPLWAMNLHVAQTYTCRHSHIHIQIDTFRHDKLF